MWIDSDLFDDFDDVDDADLAADDALTDEESTLLDDPLAVLADPDTISLPDLTDSDALFSPDEAVIKPLSVLDLRKEFDQLRFCGGCDCGSSPATCGAAHFCRWQY